MEVARHLKHEHTIEVITEIQIIQFNNEKYSNALCKKEHITYTYFGFFFSGPLTNCAHVNNLFPYFTTCFTSNEGVLNVTFHT